MIEDTLTLSSSSIDERGCAHSVVWFGGDVTISIGLLNVLFGELFVNLASSSWTSLRDRLSSDVLRGEPTVGEPGRPAPDLRFSKLLKKFCSTPSPAGVLPSFCNETPNVKHQR